MTDSKLDINREEPGKAIAIVGSVADARRVGGLGTERLTTCFAQLWSQLPERVPRLLYPGQLLPRLGSDSLRYPFANMLVAQSRPAHPTQSSFYSSLRSEKNW